MATTHETVLWAAGGAQPDGLWPPLYYRKGGEVWRWTPAGGSQTFLPGVTWYYPTISSDGRYLAYAVVGADGLHDVYLIDLQAGGSPQKIGNGHRTVPVFLNARPLWFKSDSLGGCGGGGSRPLVYDVGDRTESASIVDMPVSVWPATSSDF